MSCRSREVGADQLLPGGQASPAPRSCTFRGAEPSGAERRPSSIRLSYALTGCLLAGAVTTGACGSLSASTPDKPAAASTPAATDTPGCVRAQGLHCPWCRTGAVSQRRSVPPSGSHGTAECLAFQLRAGARSAARAAARWSPPVQSRCTSSRARTGRGRLDSGQRCADRSG
jgi:hypothetical protein